VVSVRFAIRAPGTIGPHAHVLKVALHQIDAISEKIFYDVVTHGNYEVFKTDNASRNVDTGTILRLPP
jgi:hypothetical protein